MAVIENPGLFRELSVPFESVDAANAAVKTFQEELYELRKKHRIQNLMYVFQVPIIYGDDGESHPMGCGIYGDFLKGGLMASFALGHFERQHAKYLADSAKSALAADQPEKPEKPEKKTAKKTKDA